MRFTYKNHVIKNETNLKKSNLYAKRRYNVCLSLSLKYRTKYSLSLSHPNSSQCSHDFFSFHNISLQISLYLEKCYYFSINLLTNGIQLIQALNFDRKNKDL